MSPDATAAGPRHVLLFSGHRVDVEGRVPARFPMAKVEPAQRAIEAALETLDAGSRDLAFTQGSAGGDILFGEACVARGVRLRWLQPGPEVGFLDESVRASAEGERWALRYAALRARLDEPPQALPDADRIAPAARFERCNRWLLDCALGWGAARLRFICLWDGAPSDAPGGTADLVEQVRRCGIAPIWLDVRRL